METSERHKRVARRAAWPAAAGLAAVLGLLALSTAHKSPSAPAPHAFGWLRAARPPSGWKVATTRSGASLVFPPDWREIQTDRGTVSAAPAGGRGYFAGYLNATPLGGDETLANWRRFRIAHVAEEGARGVRLEASATGLRFPWGRASCVLDSYSTTRARFREIACIVAGARATAVVVAAAPTDAWARQAPVLERAVSSFTTRDVTPRSRS